jgi:hypothetical protein
MRLQARDLTAGVLTAIVTFDRTRQAAWLRVRAAEYRQQATVVGSASRRECLDLAARFEDLSVAVQRSRR